MKDDELISKKELLILTGISYGQLYRWKRENLIPESWFVKQSSFTGQETFFPKYKIIERIQMIQELKDKYSLDDLANMLSPELKNRSFKLDELTSLDGMDPEVVKLYEKVMKKEYFVFSELVFLYIISSAKKEVKLQWTDLENAVASIRKWISHLKEGSFRLILCRHKDSIFFMFLNIDALIFLDGNTIELKTYYMDEISKDLKIKYNNILEGI